MNKETILYRETPQRRKILSTLCSTNSHPTADWIYSQAKKEFPHLSLGTVYRNLRILRDQGRIRELPFGDTFDRYDGRTDFHIHFVCNKCHRVIDVEEEVPLRYKDKLKTMKYKVEDVKITFYGLCANCH